MSTTAISFSISLRNAVSALLPSSSHWPLRFPCARHPWPSIPYLIKLHCLISFCKSAGTHPGHMHLFSFLMEMPAYTSPVNLQTRMLCVSGMLHALKKRSMVSHKATSLFFPPIFPIIFLCSDANRFWTTVCLGNTLIHKYYLLSLY